MSYKNTPDLLAEILAVAMLLAIVYFLFAGYDCSEELRNVLPDNVTIKELR